ncbi:hypothetical protein [Gryllotalpicola protaetiae]|uniref:Uncharacterized protein n=1 Tax=Gryllotalpicola protaetiae TaxID=2419771 RepID=A0A387BLQ5_9MICO|nr:hypothetical protein [Gryllotalpicola protaetiae]AYG03302.1 hypothetical protein D7I44_06995 [Gryllotalpicola protaetiae]
MSTTTTASAHRRRFGVLAAVAVGAMAVITAGLGGNGGTYALWNDTVNIGSGATITAGSPSLSVQGFEDLDHEYREGYLEAQATVTVTNDGNTRLHSFAVERSHSGAGALYNAVSTTFTPVDATGSSEWDTWLSDVTLAPGEHVVYTVRTTLAANDFAGLSALEMTTNVTVSAQAGTSWTASDSNAFTQTVTESPGPDVPTDDFNMRFMTDPAGNTPLPPAGVETYSIYVHWSWEVPNAHTRMTLVINDVALDPPGQGISDGYHASLSPWSIPGGPPAVNSPAVPIVIEVVADRGTASELVIARGTFWLQQTNSGFWFFPTDPAISSASGHGPESLAPTPEPDAEVAPNTIEEVELRVSDRGDGTLELSWQNPVEIPDDTSHTLYLNGQPTGDQTDTTNPVFILTPTRISAELWATENDAREVVVTIVPELTDGPGEPIAHTIIWVTTASNGTFTLHATNPAA